MNRLVIIIFLISLGGGNDYFVILQRTSSGNLLGAFYRHLTMRLNNTRFGGKLKHLSLRRGKLQYTDILVGRHI